MKFFEAVTQITSKITTLFHEFISSYTPTIKKNHSTHAERVKLGKKCGKKNPTFAQFLRKNSNSSCSSCGRSSNKSSRHHISLKGQNKFKCNSHQDENSSIDRQNLDEKITGEVLPLRGLILEKEPVFKYVNGIQISIIEQQQNKNEPMDNSDENDPEILKFVYGEDVPSTKSCHTAKQNWIDQLVMRRQLWREVQQNEEIEKQSSLNQRVSSVRDIDEEYLASGQDSYNSCRSKNIKSRRIIHKRRPKSLKRAKNRVIFIIDLTQNEDHPKYFQIPLELIGK